MSESSIPGLISAPGHADPPHSISPFIRDNVLLIAVGAVGVSLLVYGLYLAVVPEPPHVEIVNSRETVENDTPTLYVDVAGAVQRPGVYRLPADSRIGDALAAAGGVAANADRGWTAQNLNLAQTLKDGSKIYIPENQQPAMSAESAHLPVGTSEIPVGQRNTRININTATQSELETLSGIGEARAQSIIANRPYGSPDEIVTKAKIPEKLYEELKSSLSVY